jgi:16S rRNA (uracil1498-N3)-methyltransferase
LRRFFCESPIEVPRAEISGAEAHHLLHVLRLGIGDEVTLFDGNGAEFSAKISAAARQKVELIIVRQIAADRELVGELTLAVALPKGDRQRWLVEKAVELGVTRIIPLRCERSVVASSSSRTAERLRRTVIEASKQCGRNRLAMIAPAIDFVDWIGREPGNELRLLAHQDETSRPIQEVLLQRPSPQVEIAIGPEGGLSDAELVAASTAGWQTITLGPRRLRVETAALAAIAAVTLGNTGRTTVC